MRYKERIPDELFQDDGHYLGRPADFNDRIVLRRIRLLERIKGFTNNKLSLLDIGCGNGASMFLLSDKMEKCIGIEITKEHESEFSHYKKIKNINNCEYKGIGCCKSSSI